MKTKFFILCFAVIMTLVFYSCKQTQNELKLIPIKSGEKWGYINKKGEYIINPQFSKADFFVNGLAKVVSPEEKTGFIDEEGVYKISAQYKDATRFSEGLAFVVSDGGYPTCIDQSGETKFILKEAKYVYAFSNGLAKFTVVDKDQNRKVGFVDKSGKVVINPQFEDAEPFSEGLAAVKQNDKWGFIDKTGKIVINPQFEEVSPFIEGKAIFQNGEKWGFIDKKGSYIINPQFDEALFFSEGLAAVKQGELYGFINEKGQFKINPQFEEMMFFSDGLAMFIQGDKCGYINKDGKYEINPQFERAGLFFDNIAPVKSSGKWGIIDKKGKYVINPQFDDISVEVFISRLIVDVLSSEHIRSDFYDASTFIDKLFKKSGDNSFDGFTATSTLQNIIDNPLYDDANAPDKYTVIVEKEQSMTDDISIESTFFHFNNAIYETVTTYSDYGYETGTRNQYKFNEKISGIQYQFDLSKNALGKGGAVANALKTGIENRYKIKMESKNGKYFILQDNKPSFAINYSNYSLALHIGFDKERIKTIINEDNE